MINITVPLGPKNPDPTGTDGSAVADPLTTTLERLFGKDVKDVRQYIWGPTSPDQTTTNTDKGASGNEAVSGPTTINGNLDDLIKWLSAHAAELLFALVVICLILFGVVGIIRR